MKFFRGKGCSQRGAVDLIPRSLSCLLSGSLGSLGVLSCAVMCCHVMSCPVLVTLVLSCPVIPSIDLSSLDLYSTDLSCLDLSRGAPARSLNSMIKQPSRPPSDQGGMRLNHAMIHTRRTRQRSDQLTPVVPLPLALPQPPPLTLCSATPPSSEELIHRHGGAGDPDSVAARARAEGRVTSPAGGEREGGAEYAKRIIQGTAVSAIFLPLFST